MPQPIISDLVRRRELKWYMKQEKLIKESNMKFKKINPLRLALFGVILLLLISFLSPDLAIRRYALIHLKPITSINLNSTNMDYYDRDFGHLFDVTGYVDYQTKDEIGVFYLKKYWIFWNVSSVGTGP
jgi:hypothetical protein